MKSIELRPIKETSEDYDRLEALIKKIFREHIYLPLMKELKAEPEVLSNDEEDDIIQAIRDGRLTFYRGVFKGKLNAKLTKGLRSIDAKWDNTSKVFKLPSSELSDEIKNAIKVSESNYQRIQDKLGKKLDSVFPEEIAEKLKAEKIFDSLLIKTDKNIKKSMKNLTVSPDLTKSQRDRISAEYTKNLQLYIQDFTAKEIQQLRKDIQQNALSGNRYENMVGSIVKSYGVSERKAKFLARQETSLLMTKFKQVRYEDAGVKQYKWRCVAGSANHPVRPMHKALDGKIFSWSNPPVTDETGSRNNPGQDYNCRCFAIPIVKF